jgi:FkbM family methyltransferase
MSWSPRNTLFDDVSYRNILNKTVPLIEHFSHAGQGRVCLDIGCSMGEYTAMYAQYFDRVHAFDPRETIDHNPHIDWEVVAFHPVGVGDREVKKEFYDLLDCEGLSSFDLDSLKTQAKALGVTHDAESIQISTKQLITIDSLELEEVDFIKVDVEYGGQAVLVGAVQTITEWRPTVQVESHGQDLDDIRQFMQDRKYTMTKNKELVFDRKDRGLRAINMDAIFIPEERCNE